MPLLGNPVRHPVAVAATVAALALAAVGPAATAATAAAAAATSAYVDAVTADGATHLWRLNEAGGSTSADAIGSDALTVDGSATRGTAGPSSTEVSPATTFSGLSTTPATTTRSVIGPQSFSVEVWFRTTSTAGGKLIGFGSSSSGYSVEYDRHLFLTSAGNVAFGVYPGGYRTLVSPATYNNGVWHHAIGSMNGSGMDLFVDGRRVGHDTSTAGAEQFSGYWRVAGDNLLDWPNRPAGFSVSAALADVAVYDGPLTLGQVQSHYRASGRSLPVASVPADDYGAAVVADGPQVYWRLDETSGTAARDVVSGDTSSGTYTSGVDLGADASPAGPDGTAIRLPGDSAQRMVTGTQIGNPTVFSLETWFRTTTTRGGRLIGFGNSRTGTSSSADRHIYMLDTGQLRYGITSGGQNQNVDSPAAYNDDRWHHVVATQGPGGQRLYVDGAPVASGGAATPDNYTGYWRLGTDSVWGGASSASFSGLLDEAAVYPTVLAPQTIERHYRLATPPPPNAAPTAAFTATSTYLKASFDASGSTDADGTVTGYAWDFGDGTSGTGVKPVHTYAASGTYAVALTVRDDDDATALLTRSITVTANAAPAAVFSSACTDLDCTFDGSASSDPDGRITAWNWAFGDGASGTGAKPAHSYAAGSYDVTLTVTDDGGATRAKTQKVVVTARNNPPTALAAGTCTDLDCTFDGSGSTDPDGRITAWAWDFGDGTSATGARPAHSFTDPGRHTVTLTVTDDRGATGSGGLVVTTTAPNQPPVSAFTSSCTDLACLFDGAPATDPDGSVTGYAWTFGDGASATTPTANHTYATGGTFTVTLKVTDNKGATDTSSSSVTVVDPILATDAFGRTVADGLGTADRGGAWTFTGAGASSSVADGSARVAVGSGRYAAGVLAGVSNLNTELNDVTWLEAQPGGTGVYIGTDVRVTPAGTYRARLRVQPSGVVVAQFFRNLGNVDVPLGSSVTLPFSYGATTHVHVRAQALGSSPTTLRAKFWIEGTAEPADWTLNLTDNGTGYQVAGGVGFWAYAPTTTGASAVRYDNLVASIAKP
jgi:large repetitive protein